MVLKRDLGLLHATMMGLGSTICAGVFMILGGAVGIAGPAVVLSFFLCGIVNMATMLSYCELGAAMPRVGGEYVYVRAAFGGLPAFIAGWYEWSSNLFYATLMVLGAASMLSYFIPVDKILIIVMLVVVFALLNIKGIKEAGITETLLTSILLAILLLYVIAGLRYGFRADAFKPFMPKGPLSIVGAMAFIFETYLGIEAIAATQAEIKEPEKTIPRAMILCSLILMVLYCLIAYVTIGILPPEVLIASGIPLYLVAEKTMAGVGAIMIAIAGLIAAVTSLNSAIIASSRAAYAMSRDGYFPRAMRDVHSDFGTPHTAIVAGAALILFLCIVDNLEFVVYSINFGFLIGFALVNLSLIVLRKSKPQLERPFETPLYPLTPIVGITTSLMLLVFIDVKPLAFGIGWGLLGSIVYFLTRRNDRLVHEEKGRREHYLDNEDE